MELIENLQKYFSSGSAEDQFVATEDKKVLFIIPTVTAENYYRIILPFSFISQYIPTIHTAMTGIATHNPTQPYEQRVTQGIKATHIKWADVIVFPFTSQALSPLYEEMRDINPKAKIFFNVDANVFHLPDGHPMKDFFTADRLTAVDDNILFSDCALFSNDEAKKYFVEQHFGDAKYLDRMAGRSPGVIETFPYRGHYAASYEDKKTQPGAGGKMRLAVPVNDTQYDELKLFAPHLMVVSSKLKDLVEIIIIGGRKTDAGFADAVKGINHLHVPAHPEVEMVYDEILNSKADVFLYLSKDSFFNKTSDDPKRIIDYGMVGVPCIIPSFSPMAELVRPTGWVMDQNSMLFPIIEQIAHHKVTLDEHAVATFNSTIKNLSYGNSEAMIGITSIFEQ